MIEALKDLLMFNEKSGVQKWNYETLNLLEGIGVLVGHMAPGSPDQANVMEVRLSPELFFSHPCCSSYW